MKIGRVFGVLVWVGVLGVCFGESEKWPTAGELLAEFGRTQDKLKSCAITANDSEVHRISSRKEPMRVYYDTDFRWDGKRLSLSTNMWGDMLYLNKPIEKDDKYIYRLWDEERRLRYSFNDKASNDRVMIERGVKAKDDYIEGHYRGRDMLGFLGEDFERIDHILKGQEGVKLGDNTEYVQGMNCYVIDAKVREGSYKLWVCPERDYHIVKAMVRKDGGNTHMANVLPGGVTITASMEVTDFKKIDGVWVPMAAKSTYEQRQRDGSSDSCERVHTREEVTINPDHEKRDSFGTSRIRNGAKVYVAGRDGVYTWQDGNVVDSGGRCIGLKMGGSEKN